MKTKTYAAIDIGSNAIRLLINDIDHSTSSTEFKKAAFLRVPIRLGEDVFTYGAIHEEKLQRLEDAMIGFQHIMKAYRVDQYKACATSAMRDAANGSEVVRKIKEIAGIDIEIITGQEEGNMIFEAGGIEQIMDYDRNYLYVDVGGGSTEIVLYSKHQKIRSESFQIGTVRMLADKVEKAEKKRFKEWLKEIYKGYYPMSIIGSGGNINKVHKLLGKRELEPVGYTELKILYQTLKEMNDEERILNYKLKSYRADVIVPAMKIFATVSKICKVDKIYIPKVGLADGIIHHLYYEKTK